MCRRLFYISSILSLLLCVATAAAWVRSYHSYQLVTIERYRDYSLGCIQGEVWFVVDTAGTDEGDPTTNRDVWRSYPYSAGWRLLTDKSLELLPLSYLSGNARFFGSYREFHFGDFYTFIGEQLNYCVLPCWLPVTAAGVLPLWAMIVIWRRTRGRPAVACSRCGYDLRATPDRCPECGATNTSSPECRHPFFLRP
jgi:hypothetical protein